MAQNSENKALMQWVSVADMLPEKEGSYIVCTDKGGVLTAHWHSSHGKWGCGYAGKHITHWMPLPKPPQTEDISDKELLEAVKEIFTGDQLASAYVKAVKRNIELEKEIEKKEQE